MSRYGMPSSSYPTAYPGVSYPRRDKYQLGTSSRSSNRPRDDYRRSRDDYHRSRDDSRHSRDDTRHSRSDYRDQRRQRDDHRSGQRGGQRGGRGQRGGSRGRGRGRGGANVVRDPKTGKKLSKQAVGQKAVEERRKQTGFFFFYEKKLRCCIKVVSKECPHILQPQPWDLLTIYDDPSYVDETIDAPYMKEVEQQQEIKRKRIEKKYDKDIGSVKEGQNGKDVVDLTEDGNEVVDLTEDEKMEDDEKGEKKEKEETPPTQTLTLGSSLSNLASSETQATTTESTAEGDEKESEKESEKEGEKEGEKEKAAEKEKEPWIWPQPYTPKQLTKRQKKQKRQVPQGLGCMASIAEQQRLKYNHSWVQVHKQKPWIEIPCIKRLVQRRGELKEEFEDLVKHLKWHPDDSEAMKKRNEAEKVFKRLRNRVHSFLKRLELQYMTAGNEGVQDLIGLFLEERQEEDGIEVIFKKEHDDAAAERLAAEEEAKRMEESKRPRDSANDDDDAAETNGDSADGASSEKRAKTESSDTNDKGSS